MGRVPFDTHGIDCNNGHENYNHKDDNEYDHYNHSDNHNHHHYGDDVAPEYRSRHAVQETRKSLSSAAWP